MRKKMFTKRFLRDQDGGPFVEVAVLLPILFVFLLGSVDFLNAFIQWNQATKAVDVGARIAAVSDPVATGLTGTTNIATSPVNGTTVNIGDAMPAFTVTCTGNGSAGNCTCTGYCTGYGAYSEAAMSLIIFGRDGKGICGDETSYYFAGMCDIFPRIGCLSTSRACPSVPQVTVVYTQTGLGFAGRSAGPVPTISVSLTNLQFEYFFLEGFLKFTKLITMPPLTTTITGEALSSAAAN
jgi:Flp pilus assembly pilin Flp